MHVFNHLTVYLWSSWE